MKRRMAAVRSLTLVKLLRRMAWRVTTKKISGDSTMFNQDPLVGRCCVVAWWARFGAVVLSSDGEDEFGEGVRDPMPRVGINAEFVMAAVKILDEGVSRADYSR